MAERGVRENRFMREKKEVSEMSGWRQNATYGIQYTVWETGYRIRENSGCRSFSPDPMPFVVFPGSLNPPSGQR
jgi:hypothetical protein